MHLRLHFRRCQECLQGFVAYHQEDRPLFCWQVTAVNLAIHMKITDFKVGALALPTKSACTFIILIQISRGWEVVLFGFASGGSNKSRKPFAGLARWRSGPDTASEPLPAHNLSGHRTVSLRGWIFIFF